MEPLVQGTSGLRTSAQTGWPRVSQPVYEGIFIAYLPAIIIAVMARMAVKIRNRRPLELEDGFLTLALCSSLASWACTWQMRDLIYLQMELVLGMKPVLVEDVFYMIAYFKWYNASLVTTWMSVYSVKLSFMFFFRKLITRVRPLEAYWRVIMVILIPTAIFSAFFSFWICPDLTITYIANCPISSMIYREEVYLYATAALDIFTDLLIISIPILLLSRVSISFKRKLILGVALSLSIFMIVICIVRMATCKLPNGVIDSTWLGLWQCFETNTAIIIMSLTAYRKLYRQGASPSYVTPEGVQRRPLWPSLRLFRRPVRDETVAQSEAVAQMDAVLPEKPRRTAVIKTRTATRDEIRSQLLSSMNGTLNTLESTIISDDGL